MRHQRRNRNRGISPRVPKGKRQPPSPARDNDQTPRRNAEDFNKRRDMKKSPAARARLLLQQQSGGDTGNGGLSRQQRAFLAIASGKKNKANGNERSGRVTRSRAKANIDEKKEDFSFTLPFSAHDESDNDAWSQNEDIKLRQAVDRFGTNWKHVSHELRKVGFPRTDVQCLYHWKKLQNDDKLKNLSQQLGQTSKAPWSEEEDRTIISCREAGITKWSEIATRIPGRSGKQCRERWFTALDPNIVKGGWTETEDRQLLVACSKYGDRWDKIAPLLPGRSESAVRNRWRSISNSNQSESESKKGESGENGISSGTENQKYLHRKQQQSGKNSSYPPPAPPRKNNNSVGRNTGESTNSSVSTLVNTSGESTISDDSSITSIDTRSLPLQDNDYGLSTVKENSKKSESKSAKSKNGKEKSEKEKEKPLTAAQLRKMADDFVQAEADRQLLLNNIELDENEKGMMRRAFIAGMKLKPSEEELNAALEDENQPTELCWDFEGSGSLDAMGFSFDEPFEGFIENNMLGDSTSKVNLNTSSASQNTIAGGSSNGTSNSKSKNSNNINAKYKDEDNLLSIGLNGSLNGGLNFSLIPGDLNMNILDSSENFGSGNFGIDGPTNLDDVNYSMLNMSLDNGELRSALNGMTEEEENGSSQAVGKNAVNALSDELTRRGVNLPKS
eukprot:g4203.t1